MEPRSKRMTGQHVIDGEAQCLLRAILPKHWVLREYRPDYGLDFALEVFREVPAGNGKGSGIRFETLGEHVFLQLKGASKADRRTLKVYSRGNVEKMHSSENRNDLHAEIETLPFSIETSELVTVQRMGAAIPVLLIRADLAMRKCYFVCLNDYIDKILVPRHGDYTKKASRTIHIPSWNDLSQPEIGINALRWYAKRVKLFAAFQKFIYQHVELSYAIDRAEFRRLAQHFALLLANYDFWTDTPLWCPIQYYGAALQRFLNEGQPGLTQINEAAVTQAAQDDQERLHEIKNHLADTDVMELWRCLSVLPRNYEELCREWFLPTSLGLDTSYNPD
ncbi:MAG: DUF4365 domain-containing protein [Nitrospira sp.]|nr:DUF4365 domain-containing protein [Nitrospira sp.]